MPLPATIAREREEREARLRTFRARMARQQAGGLCLGSLDEIEAAIGEWVAEDLAASQAAVLPRATRSWILFCAVLGLALVTGFVVLGGGR
jgi:hypothetical protein